MLANDPLSFLSNDKSTSATNRLNIANYTAQILAAFSVCISIPDMTYNVFGGTLNLTQPNSVCIAKTVLYVRLSSLQL